MDVSDRERERILDDEIYTAIKLLAMVYPPGCKGRIVIPEIAGIKKSEKGLTLRWCVVKIFKLIDNWKVDMAIIQCPECKKEISDTAPTCPGCGYALNPTPVEVIVKKKGVGCIGIFFLLILAFIIIALVC